MANELSNVEWSSTTFNMAQIINYCEPHLPVIMKIDEDYHGDDDTPFLKKGTILCISCVGFQKRAIASDQNRRSLSIPLDYPFKFEIKTASGFSKPKPLYDILDFLDPPVIVRFDSNIAKGIYLSIAGAPTMGAEQFGELVLKWMYQEKFLQGAIIEGDSHTYTNYIVMPCHVNVKMRIGNGIIGHTKEYWDMFKNRFDLHPDVYSLPALQGSCHVLVFNDMAYSEEEIYCNIESSNYGLLRTHSVCTDAASHDSGYTESQGDSHLPHRPRSGADSVTTDPSLIELDHAIDQIDIASHIYANDRIDMPDYVNITIYGKPKQPPHKNPIAPPLPLRENKKKNFSGSLQRLHSDNNDSGVSVHQHHIQPQMTGNRGDRQDWNQSVPAPHQYPTSAQSLPISRQHTLPTQDVPPARPQQTRNSLPSVSENQAMQTARFHKSESLPTPDVSQKPQQIGSNMPAQSPRVTLNPQRHGSNMPVQSLQMTQNPQRHGSSMPAQSPRMTQNPQRHGSNMPAQSPQMTQNPQRHGSNMPAQSPRMTQNLQQHGSNMPAQSPHNSDWVSSQSNVREDMSNIQLPQNLSKNKKKGFFSKKK